MMPDKAKLFTKLDTMGETTVREKLALNAFHKDKIPLVNEWLRQKAQPDYRTWVYHELELPKGKIVTRSEADTLYKAGWVDTPAKFGKGIRGQWYRFIIFSRTTLKQFWLDHWKWLITTSIAILALYFSLTK